MKIIGGLIVACALVGVLHSGDPFIIYNGSDSMPRGFFIRTSAPIVEGAFVTVIARDVAGSYATARHYDDPSDRFIKRVVAVSGGLICAQGDAVRIDARTLRRHTYDTSGRALPHWRGCRALATDEVLLLGDGPDSFDGRYWGPTRTSDIEAVWRRL